MQNYFHPPRIQISVWQSSEPKPPLLIRKRHLKTNNEGTLSCSLKTYCITVLKAHCIIMCSRVFWERLTDWLSVITCLWYGIHSSAQSSYINIFTRKIILNVHWGKRYLCRTILSSVRVYFRWQCRLVHLLAPSYKKSKINKLLKVK